MWYRRQAVAHEVIPALNTADGPNGTAKTGTV